MWRFCIKLKYLSSIKYEIVFQLKINEKLKSGVFVEFLLCLMNSSVCTFYFRLMKRL